MYHSLSRAQRIVTILLVLVLTVLPSAVLADSQSATLVSTSISEVVIIADDAVSAIGFTVDGQIYTTPVSVLKGGGVDIHLSSLPSGKQLYTVVEGDAAQVLTDRSIHLYNIRSERVIVTLSFGTPSIPENPTPTPTVTPTETPTVTPTVTPTGTPEPGVRPTPSEPDTPSPSEPVRPDVPDTPGTPDTPGADTPGSDEPGSDKPGSDEPGLDEPGSDGPFVPILPPAGSVYNIAGSIPLAAGALLLFLLVFWRRKVYRLLKHHAKQYGEKPDKQQLKATAAAVVALLQNKELYPEWRKNKETLARLLADIERALDETQYPQSIPREPVVTDIIKAAKGRINRYRL